MTRDVPVNLVDQLNPKTPAPASVPRADRYAGAARYVFGFVVGLIAGALLIGSIQVGVGWATDGHNPEDWDVLQWGDHWMWRALSSCAATAAAGFLAGMISRRRGSAIAVAATIPTALYWATTAWTGWSRKISDVADVTNFVGDALGTITGSSSSTTKTLKRLAGNFVVPQYGRQQELDADSRGLAILQGLGYRDPGATMCAALRHLRTMVGEGRRRVLHRSPGPF